MNDKRESEFTLLLTINAIHPNAGKTNVEIARLLNRYTSQTRAGEQARPGSTNDRVRYAAEVRPGPVDPNFVSIDARVLWQLLADAYRDGYAAARLAYRLETTIKQQAEDLDLTPKEAMAAALRHAGQGLRRAENLYRTATADAADDAALNDILAALHDLAFRLDPAAGEGD